jgi:hypothetical protein
MSIKRLSPDVENHFRKALGHAARAETEELGSLLGSLADVQVVEAIALCAFAAGYTAIDAVGREWPNEANLRRMALGITTGTKAMLEVAENADVDLTPAMMLRTRRLRMEAKRSKQQSSQ